MPPYSFMLRRKLGREDIARHLQANKAVGVPYTPAMIAAAYTDMVAQADPEGDHDHDALLERYPKAMIADFDGTPEELTEMDALVAYLQILGRMVDFKKYTVKDLQQ